MLRHIPTVALLGLGLVACSRDNPNERGPVPNALSDGVEFGCVPEGRAEMREPVAGTSGANRRMTTGQEFRVRYLSSDGVDGDGRLAMTAVVVFGHTIPSVEDEHFPAPIDPASANFLRPAPGGYMFFQLDAWNDAETTFSWVERDNGVSFMAHGRCWMSE